MSDNDDKEQLLQELSWHHRASIVSQLVDIGSERNQQEHVKFRSFISSLQCLQFKGSELRRWSINAFCYRRYVALSYTWAPSEHENSEPGIYPVENWDDSHFRLSPVRKCVLDRVLHYMRHNNVDFFWIDAHCIRQVTCGINDCARHLRCIEKRDAIQAMDLVYQLSEHPVALLGWELKTGSELYLLKQILSGDLVDGDCEFRLCAATPVHVATKALLLLSEITRDSWWCRAWTFQENYRGGTRMQLLIRHDPSLELQKRRHGVFGEIPGELCIQSVMFSTQATRLCLAIREVTALLRLDANRVDGVLRAAGRYALMVHSSSSMTPTVIADIEARKLSKPWDRLAIVANCCQYPVRLDGGALSRQGQSPSLSILAMCLLNGEILDNSNNNMASVAGLTTSELLDRLMFRQFHAPEDDMRQLTFNKGFDSERHCNKGPSMEAGFHHRYRKIPAEIAMDQRTKRPFNT
ncbi:ATP-dependent DNA helicase [Colletotrichum higginsianum IMI 349063]|uniref:ATP-dependent DNA helicase n=1 Tax=Colletotrichum higginsianum (strain IMI 349063) TaxID=759273 RepID=A0A1B7XQW1_COLHI|nr:ATP-dependent DNA helicase [Colletotrichum higginsianum IMI 349063]OBR02141.1 ATP-dependent DNA helicase [Colletotrichum higginsianum IMI 349063]